MRRFFEESVNTTIRLITRQVEGAIAQREQVTVSIDGLVNTPPLDNPTA